MGVQVYGMRVEEHYRRAVRAVQRAMLTSQLRFLSTDAWSSYRAFI